jgi:RNA polymerase sigma factor (sigma-70 family)
MATLPSPPSDLTPERLYLGHLDLIEAVIAQACRRCPFHREEAKDFAQHVHVKLIDDGYARIRQFRGDSSFRTYLITVIGRLLQDYQNSVWGKWRPSAEAERLGQVALWLERLLVREDRSFDEACQILRTNLKVDMPMAALADIRAKLPPKNLRRFVGEEGLQSEPSRDLRPDERLEEKERGQTRRRVYAALQRALKDLPSEDRVLMLMWTEFKVADIARIRGEAQKPLYRRLDKIKEALRKALERQGVRRQDVEEILGSWDSPTLDF